jgi:hypothetical protein
LPWQKTGLSACIFFASGKKGYRFNPLRVQKIGIVPIFGIGVCAKRKLHLSAAGG